LFAIVTFGKHRRKPTMLETRSPLIRDPLPEPPRSRATIKTEVSTPHLVANAAPAGATPFVDAAPADDEDVFTRAVKKRKYELDAIELDDGDDPIEAVMTRAAKFLAEMIDDVDVSPNVVTQILISNGWNVDDAVDRVVAHYYV
jgi:hypothetical protein